ncbi:hypothetical protein AURDEDRAFT_20698, partial [Auricularia subglabra TFB-10046 SS5]
ISLTCLNLPPDVRFSPENMHLVGVLPGPREVGVQPFLVPLVNDLLQLWRGQNFYSCVDPASNATRVRIALVPVVCDMQASRKVIGFVSPSPKANMACPFCKCTYSSMSDIDIIQGNYDIRTREEWLQQAKDFRDSLKVGVRNNLKRDNGVTWSELLRLPYWDPTRFTAVDGMHNLLLGLIQTHVRRVWGVE